MIIDEGKLIHIIMNIILASSFQYKLALLHLLYIRILVLLEASPYGFSFVPYSSDVVEAIPGCWCFYEAHEASAVNAKDVFIVLFFVQNKSSHT